MQLPGIPTRGVEQLGRGAEQTGLVIEGVTNQVAKEFNAGLQAIGSELTKTQAMRAQAKLDAGLAQVHTSLDKPYLTVREVREALGDENLDSLSPQARQFLAGKDKDDDIVPTWVVGGEIYASQAAKVRQAAARELEWSPGAQKDFNFQSNREILARQQELSGRYLQEQHTYQVSARTATYLYRIDNARTPDEWQNIQQQLAEDNVLSGPQKQDLATKASVARDTSPVYDALRTNDVGDLRHELEALNDPKQRTSLDASRRASLADAVSDRLRTNAKVDDATADEAMAAKIVDQVRDGWGHPDLARAAELVAALPNDPRKGRVRALVEHQVDRLDKVRDDSASRLFAQGQTIYESTKKGPLSAGNINDPRLQTIMAQLDSTQFQGGKYSRALRKMYDEDLGALDTLRRRAETAPATPQEQLTYLTFARLGETPAGRQYLAGLDESRLLVDWLQKMDKAHREKATGLWQDAVKGVSAPQNAQLPGAATQLVRSMAQRNGLIPDDDPKKWSPEQLSTMVDLTDKATQTYRDLTRKKNGQEPAMSELQAEIAPLVSRGSVPGTGVFRDDQTTRLEWERNPTYQAQPKETPFYPEIPKSMIPALDAAAAEAGLPAGDEKVRRQIFQTMQGLPLRSEDRFHLPVPQPPPGPKEPNPDEVLAPLTPRWEGPVRLPSAAPRSYTPPITLPKGNGKGVVDMANGALDAGDKAATAVTSSIDTAANYWLGPPKQK